MSIHEFFSQKRNEKLNRKTIHSHEFFFHIFYLLFVVDFFFKEYTKKAKPYAFTSFGRSFLGGNS